MSKRRERIQWSGNGRNRIGTWRGLRFELVGTRSHDCVRWSIVVRSCDDRLYDAMGFGNLAQAKRAAQVWLDAVLAATQEGAQ